MVKNKVILVVDDEVGYRDLLQSDLANEGFTVRTVGGGLDALEVLKKEKVDLAIVDMKMPKVDGLETVYEIRQVEPDIPIILITGYAVENLLKKALKFKNTSCLKKPFGIEEMASAIEKALATSAS